METCNKAILFNVWTHLFTSELIDMNTVLHLKTDEARALYLWGFFVYKLAGSVFLRWKYIQAMKNGVLSK